MPRLKAWPARDNSAVVCHRLPKCRRRANTALVCLHRQISGKCGNFTKRGLLCELSEEGFFFMSWHLKSYGGIRKCAVRHFLCMNSIVRKSMRWGKCWILKSQHFCFPSLECFLHCNHGSSQWYTVCWAWLFMDALSDYISRQNTWVNKVAPTTSCLPCQKPPKLSDLVYS